MMTEKNLKLGDMFERCSCGANEHWNTHRPTPWMWIIIDHPERGRLRVIRKSYVTDGSYDLVYHTEQDEEIRGHWPWQIE